MAAKPRVKGKQQVSVYFRTELLEEARGCVRTLGWEEGAPQSLSELFDSALERELARLRKKHNNGKPFRAYRSRLPGGRRS